MEGSRTEADAERVLDPESAIRMKIADIYRAISRGKCSGEQLHAACGLVTEAARILEGGVTMESVKA